jgi:Ca2+-binding RTX toxin-like protein
MILDNSKLTQSEVKLLILASSDAYQDQSSLAGWQAITPNLTQESYGLNSEFVTGDTFTRIAPDGGDANATVYQSGNTLILAFRGTEFEIDGDPNYWLQMPEFYDLFQPLFQALSNYTNANGISKVLVTGHSLGGAMTELFMAENTEQIYSAVSIASPLATNNASDDRILNIGYENDIVYEVVYEKLKTGNGANSNNSTTNLNVEVGVEHQEGLPPYNHQMINYIYGTNRVFDSAYYSQMKKDSLVIVDRTDNELLDITNIIANAPIKNAFILGENDDRDAMYGGFGNDVIEGFGENDILNGGGAGNDTLDGGTGNDSLDGEKGEDKAVFTDNFENYDVQTSGILTKTTTITHKNNGVDGIDTLKNIEWGEFKGEQIPLGNARLATDPAPRIIPLPLEDGVLDTETVRATDNTVNLNDPPTPPYVSLTAPVAMLDGNVDYTLNISPYKPNTQYNIAYIIDTSDDLTVPELDQVKSAYTNLTNYFINNGLAENINFGVVSVYTQASIKLDAQGDRNLTGEEAISAINSLTPQSFSNTDGTNYKAGLEQGINFLDTSPLKPSSSSNPGGTTNISYFFAEGGNLSSRSIMQTTAVTLRQKSNVQAFGFPNINPTVERDISFIDSNAGVIMNSHADLSTELGKSGLAGIDTVLYSNIAYPGATSLRQAASSVLYNNTDTLAEVEYLQFSDVRISAKTLAVVPILNAADVSIAEGDSGTKTAQFTFNLSSPAPGNVVFNYSTADIDAVAGTDYVAKDK